MSFFSELHDAAAPHTRCELLLQDVASLLIVSQLIRRSLFALRPECEFSRELTETLDTIVSLSEQGEQRLHELLAEAGEVLPFPRPRCEWPLATEFLSRVPASGAPEIFAADMAVSLRLLARHIELKARLAADEALLMGHDRVAEALLDWSAEWHNCGLGMRSPALRSQTQAATSDVDLIAI